MTVLPVLAIGILMKLVAVLFVLVAILLILVILIQKGRGGGLSGALGGGMASGLLGSKTGDFLTWVTIGLVAVFLVLAVLMARFYRPPVSHYGEQAPAQTQEAAPSSTPEATPPTSEANAPPTAVPTEEANVPTANTEVPTSVPPAGGADANSTADR
jgi:preprotein translocase subunit SecG